MKWPVCIALFAATALANYKFDVEPNYEHYGTRGVCMKSHIPSNSLVTGMYKVQSDKQVKTSVLVYDSKGNQLFAQPELNGEARFLFRSLGTPSDYDFCVRALPKAGNPNASTLPKSTVELVFSYGHDLFGENQVGHGAL